MVVTGHLLDGNGEAGDDMTGQGKQGADADARAVAHRKDTGERWRFRRPGKIGRCTAQ
jgi:hypothetical protein